MGVVALSAYAKIVAEGRNAVAATLRQVFDYLAAEFFLTLM